MFDTPEAAAADFARWKGGVVEAMYAWSPDWQRARIRVGDGKVFCEITRIGDGWLLRGPDKPHVLYRAAELPKRGMVLVAEGEKATDAAWSIGLPCVTSGSSDSANGADWSPLRDREIVIFPDHDEPGERYAQRVAARLAALNPPAHVRIVRLPDLGDREDLFDFVSEHRDGHESDRVRAEILSLISNTPPWTPPLPSGSEDWPDPKLLPEELPPVQAFDYGLLPESLRPWICDIAERVQCPPDYSAATAMVMLATVVGRKVAIRPKRHDDWTVVANLWGAAVGPPGVMKTPAIEEPLKPLKRLEIDAKDQYERDLLDHQARQLVADQRKVVAKGAVKEALANQSGDPLAIARAALSSGEPEPVRKRYLVNDSTVEKLGEILNQNPVGVLCFRDELVGLLRSLDKDGQEGARGFYLEAWNGTGRYTYDRIGRGTIDIEAAIVSLFGSIQPGPLRAYLHAAISQEAGADGLVQRFQLAVYPDISREWRNVDRWPDTDAKSRAIEVVQYLSRLHAQDIGAQNDDSNRHEIPYVRFDAIAQEQFDAWRFDLEHRLRSGAEHPVITAHLAKFRSLVPSLALLCHLAERHCGPVGFDSIERAIAWARYLESHARRIYSVAVAPDTAEGIALARKITGGELADSFALRDVYRNGWIGLGSRDAAERAVQLLCDLDWLREEVEETAGRPRTRYVVNPKIMRTAQPRADKTDKRSSE